LKKTATIIALLCILVFAGCNGTKVKILFIGNSFTSVNNLPFQLTKLAKSGGIQVEAVMCATGGYRLSQHITSQDTLEKIKSRKWDYIVIQEQSQVPAIESEKNNGMYPAVREFYRIITDSGAVPILYMTWGRKNGCPEIGYSDYESMQEHLTDGYMGIANELGIEVAPVGEAWKTAHARRTELELWGPDAIHPSLAGTYLAACVFYTVIFKKSPESLMYNAGLGWGDAAFLQSVAADTVLKDMKKWLIIR